MARSKKKSKKKKIKKKESKKAPAAKKKYAKPAKPKRKNKKPKPVQSRFADSEKREIWKKNLVLAGVALLLVFFNAWFYFYGKQKKEVQKDAQNIQETGSPVAETAINKNANRPPTQEEIEAEKTKKMVEDLLEKEAMEKWKTYKNTAYGFMLKYPENWPVPTVAKRTKETKYYHKVSFRESKEGQKGFDIIVYKSPTKKDNKLDPNYSDSITIKDTAGEDFSNCPELDVHEVGPKSYPAVEVAALKDNPCFAETYFFSLQKGSYVYDIVPLPDGGIGYPGYDGEAQTAKTLPEFEKMLSTFEFITVVANRTKVVPRITAPKPLAKLKIVNGKRTCAKKNDKPRKSKQNKKKHMDMECCLDPDEIPNPWCTY